MLKIITINTETHKVVPIEPTVEFFKLANIADNESCSWLKRAADNETIYHCVIDSAPEFNESPWLPVETAPKDFCTVFDGWNGERVANVFWGHPEYTEKGIYDWVTSEYIQGFGNENQRVRNLTHWMPLPPTPEEICTKRIEIF